MPRDSQFMQFVVEQMAVAGPVRARAMFGGFGLFDGERMFAIIVADTLYLKADAQTRGDFEQLGLAPFRYSARGRSIVSVGYFAAPPDVFEDPAMMKTWVRKAQDAALRAQRNPAKKSAKPAARAKRAQASRKP